MPPLPPPSSAHASNASGRAPVPSPIKKVADGAFKVFALALAVAVTTWLACTTQEGRPAENSTPSTPTSTRPAVQTKRASTRVDAGPQVIPSTKLFVLPPPSQDAGNVDLSQPFIPATKSGRISPDAIRNLKRRKNTAPKNTDQAPSLEVFPGTKAAPMPVLPRPSEPEPQAQGTQP